MKPIHVYVLLTVSFLLFSISIYLQPNSVPETKAFDKHKASEGRLVFQKYNCQACHQFYGLGDPILPMYIHA
ncbi:MAG TPA: hypothetical protein PLI97_01770 [Fluviicola sp.]|nr:hypothetical protein [Fluviicola sp.]